MDLEKLRKAIKNITPEDIEKYFPKDTTPHGWVNIEDHLPKCMIDDFIEQGYSIYRVKTKGGDEFDIGVCDHDAWYYDAKKMGVTHWWNEDGIKDE